jgi:hypothetical protein
VTSGLKAVCGYNNCSVKGWSNLQAAHIRPYIKGGKDDPENGVFLCHQHHLEQEGLSLSQQVKILRREIVVHTVLDYHTTQTKKKASRVSGKTRSRQTQKHSRRLKSQRGPLAA